MASIIHFMRFMSVICLRVFYLWPAVFWLFIFFFLGPPLVYVRKTRSKVVDGKKFAHFAAALLKIVVQMKRQFGILHLAIQESGNRSLFTTHAVKR